MYVFRNNLFYNLYNFPFISSGKSLHILLVVIVKHSFPMTSLLTSKSFQINNRHMKLHDRPPFAAAGGKDRLIDSRTLTHTFCGSGGSVRTLLCSSVHRDQVCADQTSTDLLKSGRRFCWSREAQYLYIRRLSSRSFSAILMV